MLSICMNINMSACLATDLSIDEAVEMALTRNNDVKLLMKKNKAAQANYEATKGQMGLSISLGSNLSTKDGVNSIFEKNNSNSVSATSLYIQEIKRVEY